MDYGIIVPQGWRMDLVGIADPIEAYEAMTRVAQEAEALNFHSIWLYDHFHTIPTPTQEVTFECWTSTAALARDTKRVRIGQMVTCNSYRNPALLAKIASTVDTLSHGRLDFGIGAGWYDHEYHAYGYTYPGTGERLRRLHEAVQIILAMWTQDEATFEGQYYQVKGANQPAQGSTKAAYSPAHWRRWRKGHAQAGCPICERVQCGGRYRHHQTQICRSQAALR